MWEILFIDHLPVQREPHVSDACRAGKARLLGIVAQINN